MKTAAIFLVILVAILTVVFAPLVIFTTAPWLLIGSMDQPIITFFRDLGHGGVPADQWSEMMNVSHRSSCQVRPEDLGAMALAESSFGTNMATIVDARGVPHVGYGQFDPAAITTYLKGKDPNNFHDALPAMAEMLCAKGYGENRTLGLNNYGGCITPLCLGKTDYATWITNLGRFFNISSDVIDLAMAYVDAGTPYKFGGCSITGIDCSCLVQQVYAQLHIQLPRTAAEQYAATARIPDSDLRSGDLVFFANTYMPGISHVGIYAGNGMQVNAPTDGQRVSLQPVFTGYWGLHYAGAGRVIINA